MTRVAAAVAAFDNPVNLAPRFNTNLLTPVPGSAIVVSSGTAADPGQQDADVDSRFVTTKNNIATIGAKINAIRTAFAAPLVRII